MLTHNSNFHNKYIYTKLLAVTTLTEKEILRVQRILEFSLISLAEIQIMHKKLNKIFDSAFTNFYIINNSNNSFLYNLLYPICSSLSLNTNSSRRSAFEFVKYDVGSMKRLRVTKGICLPADCPIHVICGSKDVIHS